MNEGKTKHKQVPILTAAGVVANVDEGVFEVLRLLALAGVKTQYSCQGDEFAAYVLADGRSFSRLIRKVKRHHRKHHYSSSSRAVVNSFRGGYKECELSHFRNHGIDRVWELKLKTGRKPRHGYAYELSFSREFGYRIAVRWPKDRTWEIETLLKETLKIR